MKTSTERRRVQRAAPTVTCVGSTGTVWPGRSLAQRGRAGRRRL